VSKHRFIAAQFEAFFADELWLTLARHANAMADRLAVRLATVGIAPVWPVEANEVFVPLPRPVDARLKAAGAAYYPWSTHGLPAGMTIATDAILVRLVTSFATTEEEIAQFIAISGR
jgi:threonine aldolase